MFLSEIQYSVICTKLKAPGAYNEPYPPAQCANLTAFHSLRGPNCAQLSVPMRLAARIPPFCAFCTPFKISNAFGRKKGSPSIGEPLNQQFNYFPGSDSRPSSGFFSTAQTPERQAPHFVQSRAQPRRRFCWRFRTAKTSQTTRPITNKISSHIQITKSPI